MAKAKSEKNGPAAPERDSAKAGQMTTEGPPTPKGSGVTSVEPMVLALADQLGTFLGRVQAKADGWLENDALREQVGQIRDGAANLLKHVNAASAAARESALKLAPPKPQGREGEAAEKSAAKSTAPATKGRSGGTVDAPGKRHRKPPPQESINKRMGEPSGKQAGQKQFRAGKSRGRG